MGQGDGPVGNVLATQGRGSKSDLQNQGKEASQGAIISALGECPGQQYNLKDRKLKKSTKEIKSEVEPSLVVSACHLIYGGSVGGGRAAF